MQRQPEITTKVFILTGLMMAWMVLPLNAFSQPVVKIDHYTGCSNTEIVIPVEIEQFEDVAALTLYIGVDTENVEYIGVEDINEVFSTGDFVAGINLENQIITLNWFSLTAANLESGLMCKIRVLLKKDAVTFGFQENSEIAHSDLTIIGNVEYIDGSLVALNSYTPDPVSQTVVEGSQATIALPGNTEGITFQWQKMAEGNWFNLDDTPPYSGVQTTQLLISAVSAEMNAKVFRCLLSNDICTEGSNESELFVAPTGVEELDGKSKIVPMQAYPNPADEYLNIVFNLDIADAELRLVNAVGVIVNQQQLGDVVSGKVVSLQLDNVNPGIYVLQLFNRSQHFADIKVLRK
ncbi:MAG: T9SS type A sorting domain-containing protein [Bacteroidales bacterium]|nr:T9SS type A sorting domain-containing protein [Bacteroidales bacterium]